MSMRIAAWRCAQCGQQNLGRSKDGKYMIRACQYCGKPIPEDTEGNLYYRLEPPIYIEDESVVASVMQEENLWFCGNCGSGNTNPAKDAGTKTCDSCGSSFKTRQMRTKAYLEGEDLSEDGIKHAKQAHQTEEDAKANVDENARTDEVDYQEPVGLFATAAAAAKKTERTDWNKEEAERQLNKRLNRVSEDTRVLVSPAKYAPKKIALGALAGLVVLSLCLLTAVGLYNLANQPPLMGTVQNFYWTSSINVHGPIIATHETWESSLPQGYIDKSCSLRNTGKYEQMPQQYVTGYEQKPEKYVTGYEQKQVKQQSGYNQKKVTVSHPDSCVDVPHSSTVSCTKFKNGVEYSSTCPGPTTYTQKCSPVADTYSYVDDLSSPKYVYVYVDDKTKPIYSTRMVDDTTKPIYSTRMVDDPSRPIKASYCSYTIKEFPVVRTPTDSGYTKNPLKPKYNLGTEEYVDQVSISEYLVIGFSVKKDNKDVPTVITMTVNSPSDWTTLNVGSKVIVDNLLGNYTGYHMPTPKELEKAGLTK